MSRKHIAIPTLIAALLALSACGQMKAGVQTFHAAQGTKQLPSEVNNDSYGYYGYEEAMGTDEEEVIEVISPKKNQAATKTEGTKAEPVKTEPVKEEAPKTQTPKPQAPKAETPKTEPKVTPKPESKPEVRPGKPTLPNEEVEDPAPDAEEEPEIPEIAKSEMVGPGVLKPTVYYYVVINEDTNNCAANTKKPLYGEGGKILLKVCPKTAAACSLQGTCGVVQRGVTHTYNIIGHFEGQDRFFEIPDDGCRFGYGVRSACLDPFYTLAADLTIYKPGEVIYIPAVVGLELPDGSKHSGYFVIRDRGRGIKGLGRFDFFTGHYSWLNKENPFKKLGLGDVKTNIPYFRIKGEAAKKVQAYRSYPNLPPYAVSK
ncbi:3D domain-containing protein [Bdellovibrio bacteriovorus]|uniref:3D domain-containing protein n=1 Tax=Bdellovibrio bacteriovorus TaxID=959 RepID=UPI0035A6857E